MEYKAIKCKSAINKIKQSRVPYDYDLNIYRGCFHGCKYCYALYSHRYLSDKSSSDFFKTVFYKENIVEQLEKELQAKSWQKEVINIGSVCDSYQPIERELKLTRAVLEVMLKYENPIIISTKSTLVLRDLDLLSELAKKTYVSVSLTITSASNAFNELFEPNAPSYQERFKALKLLKDSGIRVGLHIMPTIPYLSTNLASLETLFKYASVIDVDHVIVGMLNLRGQTRTYFFDFIKENLPEYYQRLYRYFNDKEVKQKFNKEYYASVNELLKKYQINTNYTKGIPSAVKKEYNLFNYKEGCD